MDKALQAVTSIPAKAIDLDFRIGYVRPGYDADIVVWDDHPLRIGATPRQVFIDGIDVLDPAKVEESMGPASTRSLTEPEDLAVRLAIPEEAKRDFCTQATKPKQRFVVSGIRKSLLGNYPELERSASEAGSANLTLVIDDGELVCLDLESRCRHAVALLGSDAMHVNLKNGHLAPGLIAISDALGIAEINAEPATGDGSVKPGADVKNAANVDFAKYGVTLEGRAFARARLGGVTRAITAPLTEGGLVRGVSVGIRTGGEKNLLDGGLWQPDVALHVSLGEDDKTSPGSVSMAIQLLRTILKENTGKGNESVYGLVADGNLPLVILAQSKVCQTWTPNIITC